MMNSLRLAYIAEHYWDKSLEESLRPSTEPLRREYLWLGQIGLQLARDRIGLQTTRRSLVVNRPPTATDVLELNTFIRHMRRDAEEPIILALDATRHYIRAQHSELAQGATDYETFMERKVPQLL